MLSFLAWNIQKQDLSDSIINIAQKYDIDVIVLYENKISSAKLLGMLNHRSPRAYFHSQSPINGCEKIDIFTRIPNKRVIALDEDHRTTSRLFKLASTELLIIAHHGLDGRNFDPIEQGIGLGELNQFVLSVERRIGIKKTLLLGDFNVQPFETGIVAAGNLHAIHSKTIAKKMNRIVDQRTYDFFYNPMWRFFMEQPDTPLGTFYYSSGKHVNYFWYILDQVMIRPDLIDFFVDDKLEILTNDGENSLLSASRLPNTRKYSDHLPIVFTLNL